MKRGKRMVAKSQQPALLLFKCAVLPIRKCDAAPFMLPRNHAKLEAVKGYYGTKVPFQNQ